MTSNGQYTNDVVQDKDFINAYKRLPEKSNATIRFFDRGDSYTLHGIDAIYAAREYFKTTNCIRMWKSSSCELETCNLNRNHFEALLKELLLIRQYRIEIWRKSSKSGEWSMVNYASPGNLVQFEDILYSSDDQSHNIMSDPGIIALSLTTEDSINKMNCAFLDRTSRLFYICEISFKDSLADLESLLIHFGPKECLIFNSNKELSTKITKTLEKHNILMTERKKSDFSYDQECAELNKIMKREEDQNVSNMVELKNVHLVGCLNALIKYLDLLSDSSNDNAFHIKKHNLNHYLKLDCSAFKALNLLPEQSSSKNQSLFGLLNRCSTNQGQRLLIQWIKQPLIDINRLVERQNIVEIFVTDAELRENLLDNYLKKMPDFQKLEVKFLKQKANLQDCYKLYAAVESLPQMYNTLLSYEGQYSYLIREIFINPLNDIIRDFQNYQQMIESTLDFDQIKNHYYLVKSSFKPHLQELRDKLDEIDEKAKKILEKTVEALECETKSLKLETNPQIGYSMRLPRKDENLLRNNKNYEIIDSKKDGVRFRTDKMTRFSDEYIKLSQEYEEAQQSTVNEIIKIAGSYLDSLQHLNNLTSEIDVFVAFAKLVVSSQNEYIRPKLHAMGHGLINIKNGRHPCVEVQDGVNYISNDIEFKKDEKMFCIITGPNMGGKSTYIRSIGVIILMAQIGCYVPASEAEITICDCVLARMGAGDQQNKGLSTFMAEMIETSFILQTATENSLVIIDELGRGTSTYDGFGLAWSISEYLVTKIKCFSLFATHFHELTELSQELLQVFNSHVSAITSNDTLTLLYKVNPGVCDRSFGIHVAQMVNFPKSVIEDAKQKAKYFEDYCPDYKTNEVYDLETKYKHKKESEYLINDCLQQLKKLDACQVNEQDYVKKVHEFIQSKAKQANNPYFNYLIQNSI